MLCQKRFFRDHVDGAQRFFECGNRLQVSDYPDFLAIGDAALNAACAVTQVVEAALPGLVCNFVVCLRTAVVCDAHTLANFDRLNGIHAHDGLGQPAVQARVPPRMGAQTQRHSSRHDFESASDRIAIFLRFFDFSDHIL